MNFSLLNDSCADDPGQYVYGSHRWVSTALAVCVAFAAIYLIGCGMSGSPQPPSLQLPKPIDDAAAARTGSRVTLRWTTPRDTTDRLKIHGPVELRICRQLENSACVEIAAVFSAGQPGSYVDSLPLKLADGPLRPMSYQILAENDHHKNAGPSNKAQVAAGTAPPAVEMLSATTVEQGVLLHWKPVSAPKGNTSVQLLRILLTTDLKSRKEANGPSTLREPGEQTLRIAPAANHVDVGAALDRSVIFNRHYRYVAVRVSSVESGGKDLFVSSSSSSPVEIEVKDVFPPSTPVGLAAVPVSAATNGEPAEIDLSWSGNVEPDFAQYLLYRRDETDGPESHLSEVQIAPENAAVPVVSPAFRDIHVQPGHTYRYTIVAVDAAGNKSVHSDAVLATVPSP